MRPIARLSDIALIQKDSHGCNACPHVCSGPIIQASANVFIDGLPVARKGDPGIHAACCGPNTYTIEGSSGSVYVNGIAAARKDDKTIHCGGEGKIITGSPTVNCS